MHSDEARAWQRADDLLDELLDLPPGERRSALDRLAPDPELHRRVEALLAAAEGSDGPLDRDPDWTDLAGEPPPDVPEPSFSGRRLGPYVLEEEIGRGGMAVVYRGRRVDGAFAQEVAVKILGIGLLSAGAGERFRRERELLARLRHPNIAALLDGGVAEDGTPYLVMELLDGSPLDRHCDAAGLGERDRVRVLLQVCEAVAFAHRNLVVHRDIKPGNVLVTRDGVAKLLDFGIAKLLDPAEGTGEATELRSRRLTPRYAAPEQIDGRPVTTATDVFGLGKVLERLLGDATREIADVDLANIVRRARHAEPERRYADARALAEDLERWLAGRPVLATPDSPLYRARKWAGRHRGALVAATLVVAIATTGTVSTLIQSRRAAAEAANAAAVNRFLTDLFEAHDPDVAGGDDPKASELFRRGAAKARSELADRPELRAELLLTIGRIQVERGLYDDGADSLDEALRLQVELHGDGSVEAARVRDRLADLAHHQGDLAAAVDGKRRALAAFERHRPADDPDRLDVAAGLAEMLALAERFAESRDLARRILDRVPPERHVEDPAYAAAWQSLGIALEGLGDADGGAEALERAVALERALPGGHASDLAIFLNDLAIARMNLGQFDRAEAALSESLAIKRRLYGESHVQVMSTLTNLGYARVYGGKTEDGLADLLHAVEIARTLFPPPHVELVEALGAAATALRRAGRPQPALPLFEEAIALSRSVEPAKRSRNHAGHLSHFGAVLLALGRPAEAERALHESIDLYSAEENQGGARIHVARARRGVALGRLGRTADAIAELEPAIAALAEGPQGWGSREYLDWYVALAEAQIEAGRGREAEATAGAVRRRLSEHPDESSPELLAAIAAVDSLRGVPPDAP